MIHTKPKKTAESSELPALPNKRYLRILPTIVPSVQVYSQEVGHLLSCLARRFDVLDDSILRSKLQALRRFLAQKSQTFGAALHGETNKTHLNLRSTL